MTYELQTVWCVKYALTSGLFQLKGRITADGYFSEDSGPRIGFFLGKSDYRLTLEDAMAAAEEKRQRKIESLKRQLSKIETQDIKIASKS